MRILKGILWFIFALVLILFLFILAALAVDKNRTGYLKIEDNEPVKKNTYLISNARIIPMTQDTLLVNKQVYVKDGIIQEIGDDIEIPGVETIDAKNKYLTPGLIDMHVHVWDRYELGLYLSYGVTSVRNVWGMPMHLRMKKDINDEEIISPLFYTTGPKLTGPEFIGDDNLQLTSPEEAREKVMSYKERGYDFIKTYYGLTEELFEAVIEQAEVANMDIVAHPSQKVPYSYHFNPQIRSIEHAEDIVQQPLNYKLDTIKLDEVVRDFASSPNTSFCPTLMAFYNIHAMLEDGDILSSEPVQLMNPVIRLVDSKAQFERWNSTKKEDPSINERIGEQHKFHLEIMRRLNDAGVSIVCGTDAGIGVTVPGLSIHQELNLYKKSGMSNYEVLKTATVNASKVHKIMNMTGTVEVGKMANLLLLDENPLNDLATLEHPSAVFIKGRRLNRDLLDDFEGRARNRSNLVASLVRYVETLIVEK